MPEWIGDMLATDRLTTIALIAFLMWLMVRSAIKSWPFLRKLVELLNTLIGTEDSPGLVHQMSSMASSLEDLQVTQTAHGEELEKVRAQVQNSHDTNLRDDVDVIGVSVQTLVDKVDEHIELAKESDDRQDATAKIVTEYLPKIQELLGEDN